MMSAKRLSWDQMFMRIAETLGDRTSCINHKAGCVFVDELHRVITVGYNGSPRGDINCCDAGCAKLTNDPATGRPGKCRGTHAEINAILSCVQPERLREAILYTTLSPCHACMKALVQAGVRAVIFRDEYLRVIDHDTREKEDDAIRTAQRMNVTLYRYDPSTDTRTELVA
jgi:dCMP deaminase